MKETESPTDIDDEYEYWKAELPLGETHDLAKDTIQYWLTKEGHLVDPSFCD